MKSVLYGGLVLVLALALTGIASSEAIPWKAGDPPQTDAAAPAPGTPAPGAPAPAAPAPGASAPGAPAPAGTPPADGAGGAPAGSAPATPATDVKMDKAAAPVKEMLAQVERTQKLLDIETGKPAEKQDAKRIHGLKETIARLYLNASQRAKFQSNSFKADAKQAFLDQYEKPNREKAVSILLELANDALQKKDYRGAEALAKQVLACDPKNADTEALVKRIAEEKAAAKTAGTPGANTTKTPTKAPGTTGSTK